MFYFSTGYFIKETKAFFPVFPYVIRNNRGSLRELEIREIRPTSISLSPKTSTRIAIIVPRTTNYLKEKYV